MIVRTTKKNNERFQISLLRLDALTAIFGDFDLKNFGMHT